MFRWILILLFSCCALYGQAQHTYIPKNGRVRNHTGDTREDGHIKEHKRHGKWTVRKKGADSKWYFAEETNYWYGERNGRYMMFDERGDTVSVGNYHHDKQVGQWRYYSEGKLFRVSNFDAQGKPITIYTYFPDRILSGKYVYTDSTHCYAWYYTDNGHCRERGELVNDNLRNGTWYYYPSVDTVRTPNDTLPDRICEWKGGQMHGTEKRYSKGVLVSEANYYNGMLDSVQRKYQSGVLQYENYYSRGHFDGPQRTFSKGGKLISENMLVYDRVTARLQYDTITGVVVSGTWYSGNTVDSAVDRNRDGSLAYKRVLVNKTAQLYHETKYYPGGVIQDSGMSVGTIKTGEHISYYENGKKKTVVHYSKGLSTGTSDVWNEKGVHVFHGMASRGHDTIPEEVWSDNGQKLKYGTTAYNQQREKYRPDQLISYSDDLFYLHSIIVTSSYRGSGWRQAVQMEMADSVATNKREAPQFPGGEKAFYRYFQGQVHYPEMEKEAGIEGSTWIQFSVMKDGSIDSCVVVRSASAGLDREALRIIKSMPVWEARKQNGKATESKCVVEIRWVQDGGVMDKENIRFDERTQY